MRTGVFPGTFDPPTVAHVAIAEAAVAAAHLDRLDFALSRVALAKEDRGGLERRVAALERLAGTRPWLAVVVTDAQLIADIAAGYDAVVMGADKWAQVRDSAWYESVTERDAALARLPRVLVAARPGFDTEGAELLTLPDDVAAVSSTAAREGARHFIAPEARHRLIVDAMNVIGSRPDGWWRDRDGAVRRLIRATQAFARRTGDRVAVVLDGRPLPDMPEGVHDGVLVAYARRGGPNAADDRIADEVAADADPGTLTVVTSDRDLQARVEARGAQVVGAARWLSALEGERP
jgi:nicotinic acid mononucleotide adenylyltransferase/predicted RNA-binding protein with PIN domain